MNLNKKGMTLVELIISIALLSLILGFLFKILLDVKYEKDNTGFALNNQINRAEIIKFIQDDFEELGLLSVSAEDNKIIFTFNESVKNLVIEDNQKIIYGEKKWTLNETNYAFGDIEIEEINDDYVKIIIPVVNSLGENESTIDDIMLFTKYNV